MHTAAQLAALNSTGQCKAVQLHRALLSPLFRQHRTVAPRRRQPPPGGLVWQNSADASNREEGPGATLCRGAPPGAGSRRCHARAVARRQAGSGVQRLRAQRRRHQAVSLRALRPAQLLLARLPGKGLAPAQAAVSRAGLGRLARMPRSMQAVPGGCMHCTGHPSARSRLLLNPPARCKAVAELRQQLGMLADPEAPLDARRTLAVRLELDKAARRMALDLKGGRHGASHRGEQTAQRHDACSVPWRACGIHAWNCSHGASAGPALGVDAASCMPPPHNASLLVREGAAGGAAG